MSRMPLRFKLTLAFTGVMAVLLAGAGIALSLLVASNLDSTIDDGLEARAGDAAAVVRTAGASSPAPASRSRRCSTPDGDVVDTTTGAGGRPLLDAASLRERARGGVVIVERSAQDGARLRLLARPVRGGRRARRSWSSASRSAQRERALDALHALLRSAGRWRC